MSTVVDICNIALSLLGDKATVTSIDPPEGSPQADHCARFYPIALSKILGETNWSFATKRLRPAQLEVLPEAAAYAYIYPSDCIKLQRVVGQSGIEIHRYTIERSTAALAILTDEPIAWIRYTTSEVTAEMFPSGFAEALAHLLAAKLAGALITSSTGASMFEEQLKLYQLLLKDAVQLDAIQTCSEEDVRTPYVGDMKLPRYAEGHYGF